MKKKILITAIIAVCFLVALNVTIAFNSRGGLGVSLSNIEALAWIEDYPGHWIPEPGDDASNENNDPSNNLLQFDMEDCWVCTHGKAFGLDYACTDGDMQEIMYQYYYCTTAPLKNNSTCNQSTVDFNQNSTMADECLKPYQW